MADKPADPRAVLQPAYLHVHQYAAGGPSARLLHRARRPAGGVEKLRGYMREKARELGIEGIRCNAAGCLDRCEFGPNMVIYPEGVWYHYEITAGHRRDPRDARQERRPGRAADAAARPAAAEALRPGAAALPTRSSPRRPRRGIAAIAVIRALRAGARAGPSTALAGGLPPPRVARHVPVPRPESRRAAR